jgi:hypothetical protein
MMASESEPLTLEEFASLLKVGNTCAVREPSAVIPAQHSARLIELGYIADLFGRLRMTSAGRLLMGAGFENRPTRRPECVDVRSPSVWLNPPPQILASVR